MRATVNVHDVPCVSLASLNKTTADGYFIPSFISWLRGDRATFCNSCLFEVSCSMRARIFTFTYPSRFIRFFKLFLLSLSDRAIFFQHFLIATLITRTSQERFERYLIYFGESIEKKKLTSIKSKINMMN